MILAITLLAFAAQSPQPQEPNPCDNYIQNVWDPRFTPGQRWSYHARPVDAGSTLTITKIDDVPGIGLVIQIDVDHVDFFDRPPRPRGNNGTTQHFAIRRDSLDTSVLDMLEIVSLPYDPWSYHWWHNDCATRTYATTVADTIQLLQARYCAVAANGKPVPACIPAPKPSPPPRPRPVP